MMLFMVVIVALATFANSLEIVPNRHFYVSESNEVSVQCGDIAWNKDNFVTVYYNDQLIFNSGSNDEFPYISGTKNNRTIILNNQKVKGWQNLYCITNSIISENTINIPQVIVPTFTHSPDQFKINSTYTLTCDGAVYGSENVRINFMFEKYYIGTLTDGSLSMGNAPGIGLVLNYKAENSIKMIPQYDINYGAYYCTLSFKLSQTKVETVQSNIWATVNPKKV